MFRQTTETKKTEAIGKTSRTGIRRGSVLSKGLNKATRRVTKSPFSNFSRLMAPVSEQHFFDRHYEQAPLIVRRRSPRFYRDLLTFDDVDYVLATLNLRAKEIELVNADTDDRILPERYCTPDGIADPARVAAFFGEGATLIFPHLHRKLPRLAELCAGLEAEFSCSFQTNIYLTPPRSQGFKKHFDTHDVFILQVDGSKLWNVYGRPIELPMQEHSFDSQHDDPGPLTNRFKLSAGDVCYIPRGFVHEARATEKKSLHITLGVLPYLWGDLFSDIVALASSNDPSFRRGLPPGFANHEFDRAAASKEFDKLRNALLARLDFEATLNTAANRFLDRRLVPMQGQLRAMDPERPVTSKSIFAPRRHLQIRMESVSKQLFRLRANGVEVEFPSAVESAVRFALRNKYYRAREIPGALSIAEKKIILRRLLREGMIERIAD